MQVNDVERGRSVVTMNSALVCCTKDRRFDSGKIEEKFSYARSPLRRNIGPPRESFARKPLYISRSESVFAVGPMLSGVARSMVHVNRENFRPTKDYSSATTSTTTTMSMRKDTERFYDIALSVCLIRVRWPL